MSAYPIGSDTWALSYDLASRITGFGQTNSVYNRSFSYDPETVCKPIKTTSAARPRYAPPTTAPARNMGSDTVSPNPLLGRNALQSKKMPRNPGHFSEQPINSPADFFSVRFR